MIQLVANKKFLLYAPMFFSELSKTTRFISPHTRQKWHITSPGKQILRERTISSMKIHRFRPHIPLPTKKAYEYNRPVIALLSRDGNNITYLMIVHVNSYKTTKNKHNSRLKKARH